MSEQKHTADTLARAEELISRIQGISSARISADETGEITEIHVVANTRKSPKLVARDVETCLKAMLSIHVDYKKIGVVIFDSLDDEVIEEHRPSTGSSQEAITEFPIEERPARFTFQSVNVFNSQESLQAEVELVRGGIEAFGRAKSNNPSETPLRVVAEAALVAVADLLDESIRLCLSDVAEVALGEDTAIMLKVDLIQNRESKTLIGSSLYQGNANQTVVFAALNAVNRVVGRLKSKSSVEYKIS